MDRACLAVIRARGSLGEGAFMRASGDGAHLLRRLLRPPPPAIGLASDGHEIAGDVERNLEVAGAATSPRISLDRAGVDRASSAAGEEAGDAGRHPRVDSLGPRHESHGVVFAMRDRNIAPARNRRIAIRHRLSRA